MSANETRLLTALLLVVGLAGTAIHAVLRWEPRVEAPEVSAPAAQIPPHNETVLLALGAQAKSFEPATPAGSWSFVWQGPLSTLLAFESRAEAVPGGYFVTAASLRADGPVWTLEVVLSPWQEGLASPPAGTPLVTEALALALGAAPAPVQAAPKKTTPVTAAPVPAPPPQPAPLPATGEILLLGSFGDGSGKHWWFKEKATDRVFEIPGAEDWSLVQADGAAVVLQKAGRQYRVELTP